MFRVSTWLQMSEGGTYDSMDGAFYGSCSSSYMIKPWHRCLDSRHGAFFAGVGSTVTAAPFLSVILISAMSSSKRTHHQQDCHVSYGGRFNTHMHPIPSPQPSELTSTWRIAATGPETTATATPTPTSRCTGGSTSTSCASRSVTASLRTAWTSDSRARSPTSVRRRWLDEPRRRSTPPRTQNDVKKEPSNTEKQ